MEAARDLFSEVSYGATTIDDIARRANISRTTFYRHFESKWVIARALFADVMPPIHALHQKLASLDDPTERQIRSWLNGVLDILSQHKSLVQTMREASDIEPQSTTIITNTHDHFIKLLTERLPRFRLVPLSKASDLETWTRAHLLMLEFDQLCYAVAVLGTIDRATGVRIMAQEFRRFIDLASSKKRRPKTAGKRRSRPHVSS